MLKSLKEIMYHSFYENKSNELIRKINIPNYYVFSEMLELFLELHAGSNTPEPHMITVLCVTHAAYRVAIQKGFNAIYLYDILDFDDQDYQPKVQIPTFGFAILESADTISYALVKKLHEAMAPNTYFYIFYDNFIPRRYVPQEDIIALYGNCYDVTRVTSDRNVMNVVIRHFLNALRQRNNTLEQCLTKESANIQKEEITKFDLAYHLDLSKVIITPHITLVKELNWKIRNYLGLVSNADPCMPMQGEWMITERAAEAVEVVSGKKHTLPIGYRFQVKECLTTNNGSYTITFDHELPTGEVVECNTFAAKRYIEYMAFGRSETPHPPFSYCINYAYVIPHFYSVNAEYEDGVVLFDGRLSADKKDFYTAVLPIKKNLQIYYNLHKRIDY